MRHVAGSSAKEFRPRRFHFLPLSHGSTLLVDVWKLLLQHRWAPLPSSSSPPPPPTPPPSTLLRFLPPPSSSPPSSVSPSVPRRRNMAPRQEIRPSTPSLSQQPRAAPLFPGHFPSSSLASFLPPPVPVPPRCILNQSLGGNAITRHHDASTIFYFKLLYVLVPPPCLSPVPRFSSTARSTLPPPRRYVSARHTTGFAALLFCLGSSRALSLALPFLRLRPSANQATTTP